MSEETKQSHIPLGVITRLSDYLGLLLQTRKNGREFVSSKDLQALSGVNAAQVRRDFSFIKTRGRRGSGYPVDVLVTELEELLDFPADHRIALVGCGRLGSAVFRLFQDAEDAGYRGLGRYGFDICAVFEANPDKIGEPIDGLTIQDSRFITEVVAREKIPIGLITTPAISSQKVADQLVEGGARVILNYSPALIQVPKHVKLHSSDPLRDLFHTLYFLSKGQERRGGV